MEKEGVSVSWAWEAVGEVVCTGELIFLAISRAGEGDLRGISRGDHHDWVEKRAVFSLNLPQRIVWMGLVVSPR